MRSHIRGVGAAVACMVVLFGSPSIAAVAATATEHTQVSIPAYAEPALTNTNAKVVDISPNSLQGENDSTITGYNFDPAAVASEGPAAIEISPTSGPPGTGITVSGTNWTHESWASGVPIHLYQNYGNGNLKRLAEGQSGPPDNKGEFSVEMTIPFSAEAGLVTVSALTGGGYAPSAGFTVTGSSSQPPSATLTVDRAFTTNGTTSEQSTFKPGDAIWYVVSMNVENGPARATVQWRATGPREIYNYTSNQADINSGHQAPYAPAIIPQDAPSGTYTLNTYITFNGSTTMRTSSFTVSRHGNGTGGGLVARCEKAQETSDACLEILWALLIRTPVEIYIIKPLYDTCRAGNVSSCKELQAKADSLGIG